MSQRYGGLLLFTVCLVQSPCMNSFLRSCPMQHHGVLWVQSPCMLNVECKLKRVISSLYLRKTLIASWPPMAAHKPYVAAVILQLTSTGYFVISKAAFDKGLSTFVFIFYRHAAASLLLAPLAVIFERYIVLLPPSLFLLLAVAAVPHQLGSRSQEEVSATDGDDSVEAVHACNVRVRACVLIGISFCYCLRCVCDRD